MLQNKLSVSHKKLKVICWIRLRHMFLFIPIATCSDKIVVAGIGIGIGKLHVTVISISFSKFINKQTIFRKKKIFKKSKKWLWMVGSLR